MLAVHLLQCQPSFYTSQHLSGVSAVRLGSWVLILGMGLLMDV